MPTPNEQCIDFSIEPLSDAQALAFLSQERAGSWRQYPAYSKVAAWSAGAESRYVAVQEHGQTIAVANIRIKRLPILPMGIAMIAQGPAISESHQDKRSDILIALCQKFARSENLLLRVNPPLDIRADAQIPHGFTQLGDTAYETFVMDIKPDEPDLRKALNGKWRTDLRRGERSEVRIQRSSEPADFRKFQPLLTELAQSKGFIAPQDANFFADVATKASGDERFALHLAWHEDRLVGGHIGAYSGDIAVYLLGATNDEGRGLRASFLLQWAAIAYAKELGIPRYDLGGADQHDNPDVFRFKKRMNGEHYIGASMIEASPGPVSGTVIKVAERAYSLLRG